MCRRLGYLVRENWNNMVAESQRWYGDPASNQYIEGTCRRSSSAAAQYADAFRRISSALWGLGGGRFPFVVTRLSVCLLITETASRPPQLAHIRLASPRVQRAQARRALLERQRP